MKGGRRYSIGAGIADFYVTAGVFGAIAASYVAIARRPVPLWMSLLGSVFTIVAVLVYHNAVARKVRFQSVGEALMGRVMARGEKQWTNPYRVNRAALFAVVFIALVGAGNQWDSIADERFYSSLTIPVVLARVAILACVLLGAIGVGRASLVGASLITVVYLVAAVAGLAMIAGLEEPAAGVSPSLARGLGWLSLSVAVVAGLVVWGYYRTAARNAPKPVLVEGWDVPPSDDVMQGLVGSVVMVGVDGVLGPGWTSIVEFSRFARVLQVAPMQPGKLETCPRCEADSRARLTVEWEAGYESPDGNVVCEQCVIGRVTEGVEAIPFGAAPAIGAALSIKTIHKLK